ncbi:MAG: DUF4249 family protein [Bacteroidota bacterium]|nr:DUF4249 family protein [Bacteroidota bacterium]
MISFIFLGCNNPFQPEVEFTPRLNVYAVLFADTYGVYIRVTSVEKSPFDVQQPVHGAFVTLKFTDHPLLRWTFHDTTTVIDGDSVSFYYLPNDIIPGEDYTLSVEREGYLTATASATVPFSYVTIPDLDTYIALQDTNQLKFGINFNVNVSNLSSAAFVQVFVECRGLDDAGKFHAAFFNVLPVDSLNPFTEVETTTLPVAVDTTLYKEAFILAKKYTATLKVSHIYADIIVTQIDDNLYRFFITSNRTLNPLAMRTDKIVFSDIFDHAGTGIVAGASVDTTRIFLF